MLLKSILRHVSRRRAVVVAGFGLALATFAGQAPAAPIVVDQFSAKNAAYPLVNSVDASITSVSDVGIAGTIGGTRKVQLLNGAYDADGFDNAAVNVYTTPPFSFLDYASSSGAQAQMLLQFGDSAGAAALNANATGNTSLQIDLLNFDAPVGQNLNIQALIGSSNGGGVFGLPGVLVTTPGAQSVNLSLAGLSAATIGDIDGIQVFFFAPKGGDYRIDTVSLVPEPSMLGLAGIASLGLLKRRGR